MAEIPAHVRARAKPAEIPIEDFYSIKLRSYWAQFKREHFSFWMICGYLFFEYVRPQSIYPSIDFLPWAQVFLLGSLVGLLMDKNRRLVFDIAHVWMVLFLLVVILASVTARYPDYAWKHFMDFFGWFIIYFLVVNIVNTERRFIIFLSIFLVASAKLSISLTRTWAMRGFAFTDWGLAGPPGFFQNSGELAIQMLVFGPVAYGVAMFVKPYVSRMKFWILMSFPFTAGMTIMGSSSRGGQIALACQALWIFFSGRFSLKKILLVSAIIYAGITFLPQEQKDRFASAGDDRTSQQRLLYWKHGIQMIKDNPVLGIGYFGFVPYYEEHHRQDMLYREAELPHNIFIQVGTDAGYVGLTVFGLLIFRTISAGRRIRKLSAANSDGERKPFAVIAGGLLAAMWGFIIAGQFVTVTYYPFFWINLAFMISLLNVSKQHFLKSQSPPSKRAPAQA